jgi:predicted small secreted protein
MKKKILVSVIALAVLSLLAAACTRSASGSPSDVAKAESTLPNPVSTQSQLMKDIIAGTQTAMAMPLDGTAAAAEDNGDEKPATDETPAPKAEPTAKPLPTSTDGPPPVVSLNYNTTKCAPGYYVCVQSYKKDQSVVLQATYPWLLDDMDLTFKMGPEGEYDYTKYVVVGTANYSPQGSAQGFEVTLNIPDSLRGSNLVVVLLETNMADYYGSDYFTNE